jgi:hypothetical protein
MTLLGTKIKTSLENRNHSVPDSRQIGSQIMRDSHELKFTR